MSPNKQPLGAKKLFVQECTPLHLCTIPVNWKQPPSATRANIMQAYFCTQYDS